MESQFCFVLIESRSDPEHFIVQRRLSLAPLREDLSASALKKHTSRFFFRTCSADPFPADRQRHRSL